MDETSLQPALEHPALRALCAALGDRDGYLVGGAVRDLILARPLGDLDAAIDGEIEPLLERLGADARTHERFGTATLTLEGTTVDLARTRRESYPEPGALPVVEPAPIRVDLGRRDFTANALAISLADQPELFDPYDGVADIEAGLLRVIHPASFSDDPTRALRAARYAARLGFTLEDQTAILIRAADLNSVSRDRIEAELLRIGAERTAPAAFGLLSEWGLLQIDEDRLALIEAAAGLAEAAPWDALVDRAALLAELGNAPDASVSALAELAALRPASPSAGVTAAANHPDHELAIARALGGGWLDELVADWRTLELAIDGNDLLAAGIRQGPEVGRALAAVREGRLDGLIEAGREPELAAALATLQRPDDGEQA